MTKQPTLFAMPPKTRVKRMHVVDAGDPSHYDPAFPNRHIAQFGCRRCKFETDWVLMDTISETKRGIPCPRCTFDPSPLFVPLRAEYFDAFVSGDKTTEYRKYGAGWNERTCTRFRGVVLSRGYGKQDRHVGLITDFEISREPCSMDAWKACYGDQVVDVACITIQLDRR